MIVEGFVVKKQMVDTFFQTDLRHSVRHCCCLREAYRMLHRVEEGPSVVRRAIVAALQPSHAEILVDACTGKIHLQVVACYSRKEEADCDRERPCPS